jgi:hypothetical protein
MDPSDLLLYGLMGKWNPIGLARGLEEEANPPQ